MPGIWWHQIHQWKQNLPTISSRTLISTTQLLRNHSQHICTLQPACGLLRGCKPQSWKEAFFPRCPISVSTPPLLGPPCCYPPSRTWSGEKRNPNSTAQQNKETREDDEKCWELRARRGWTKRKESHSARPSPRRGRGRGRGGCGPSRSGLWAPARAGSRGRPATAGGGGECGRAGPGVRGAGRLSGITSCRRRRISGISPTLLRPPKTNAPTLTHTHARARQRQQPQLFFKARSHSHQTRWFSKKKKN